MPLAQLPAFLNQHGAALALGTLGLLAGYAAGRHAPSKVRLFAGIALAVIFTALAAAYLTTHTGWSMQGLILATALATGGTAGFYAEGLKDCPRELWLLFAYNFVETIAYSLFMTTNRLSLTADSGLGDYPAGHYLLVYTILISVFAICAGALSDTLGFKRVAIISVIILFGARLALALVNAPLPLFITAYLPMALGMAIVAPLTSIGVKRLTTKESASNGFALFYITMNIAFAIGGWMFDALREHYGQLDAAGKMVNENAGADLFGMHFSTYKIIFLVSMLATIPSLFAILVMRRSRTDIAAAKPGVATGATAKRAPLGALITGTFRDTGRMLASAASERYFWVYLALTGIILFVMSLSRHFNLTFPPYGIRVLGQGAKIGSIYGVLNPVLIIGLVPLVGALTKNISSYRLIIVGSAISALACFLVAIPGHYFDGLTHTWLGHVIFIDWLDLAKTPAELLATPPHPAYWPLIVFIVFVTIGEALWSPRFYQFAAEIAPKGKEATYMSLSVLPTFATKFIVMSMSSVLLATYTPIDKDGNALPNPDHAMVWVWIGVSAAITPIGLLLAYKWFHREEERRLASDAASLAEGEVKTEQAAHN